MLLDGLKPALASLLCTGPSWAPCLVLACPGTGPPPTSRSASQTPSLVSATHHKYSSSPDPVVGQAQRPVAMCSHVCPTSTCMCMRVVCMSVQGGATLESLVGLADQALGPLAPWSAWQDPHMHCQQEARARTPGQPATRCLSPLPGRLWAEMGPLPAKAPVHPPSKVGAPQAQSLTGAGGGLHHKPDPEASAKPRVPSTESPRPGRLGVRGGLPAYSPSPSGFPHIQPGLQRAVAPPRLHTDWRHS